MSIPSASDRVCATVTRIAEPNSWQRTDSSEHSHAVASRSLYHAHKERHAQFVSRTGCSGGVVPRNNHGAGVHDYQETP